MLAGPIYGKIEWEEGDGQLKDLIRKDFSEAVLSLQRSIRIASVKDEPAPGAPFGKEIRAALQDVLALGEQLGFKTEFLKTRWAG